MERITVKLVTKNSIDMASKITFDKNNLEGGKNYFGLFYDGANTLSGVPTMSVTELLKKLIKDWSDVISADLEK